jgi:hypothetical protein
MVLDKYVEMAQESISAIPSSMTPRLNEKDKVTDMVTICVLYLERQAGWEHSRHVCCGRGTAASRESSGEHFLRRLRLREQ